MAKKAGKTHEGLLHSRRLVCDKLYGMVVFSLFAQDLLLRHER